MSALNQPEFDFWEFVDCAKCRLPFASESGATVPFWLTECGHVVCNSHLNADQSCAQCGSPGIQLVPLQRDMDAPMSDWFRSAPYALDTIAYAVKFQQESMATQLRFYKSRHHQQRMYIEKLRHENAQLRRDNDMLSIRLQHGEAEYPQQHRDRDMQEPSNVVNSNGKRRMIEPYRTSSPRSAATPVGPDRLTLPPGQLPPQLAARQSPESHRPVAQNDDRVQQERPGSSRFTQKFAYADAAPQMNAQHMPLPQAPSRQPHRARQNQENQGPSRNPAAVPPTPSKFKPAVPRHQAPQQRQMPPPPTPQPRHEMPLQNNRSRNSIQEGSSNRFLPPEQRFAPPNVAIPSTAMGNAPKRFVPPTPAPGSRAPSSRATGQGRSGQRQPFVPRHGGGFG
ncbi:hypothetical protein C8J56DRAFT_259929 [Mycena floridula]|nr:hypothetical protein C8J56DRAFT_259929 [Mycena floridula]